METLDQSSLIRAVAFIILGATGTFLLLPHQHGRTKPRAAHLVGFGLMIVSVALFVSFWKAPGVMASFGKEPGPYVSLGFFYAFGVTAVVSAILTITSVNPIHSALWFASVVLATSGLFLLSGAQFLAAGTVIVYAGAIIVTFLFVIMLAQMEGRATYDRMSRSPFWATFTSFLLMFGLTYCLLACRMTLGRYAIETRKPTLAISLERSIDRINHPDRNLPAQNLILKKALPPTSTLPEVKDALNQGGKAELSAANRHVAGLGTTLYTEHLVTVELAGALLFAALIGALAIATPKPPIRPTSTDASSTV